MKSTIRAWFRCRRCNSSYEIKSEVDTLGWCRACYSEITDLHGREPFVIWSPTPEPKEDSK